MGATGDSTVVRLQRAPPARGSSAYLPASEAGVGWSTPGAW